MCFSSNTNVIFPYEQVPTVEAEKDAYKAAAFVAKYTMKVLEELFTEARSGTHPPG